MPSVLGHTHTTSYSKRLFTLLALIGLPFLSACSHNGAIQQNSSPLGSQLTDGEKNADNGKIKELLSAEFMLQREGPNKAFEPFYELANQSGDITLIERLTYIAVVSQNDLNVERSANLWLSKVPTAEAAYALKLQVLVKNNRAEEVTTLLINAMRYKVSLRFLPIYLEDHVRDNDQVSTIEAAIAELPPETKNNQYVQLSYAHILLLSGEYESAIETAERLLIRVNSEKSEALYLILAFSQKNLGQVDDAVKTLEAAALRFPQNSRILVPLMDFLVDNNQTKSAVDTFLQANLDTPEKLQVGINLMRTLLEYEKPQLALNIANDLPKGQLGLSDQIEFLRAIALAQLGKKSQAIKVMERVEGTLRTNATSQIALWLYEEGKEDSINAMVLNRTHREDIPEQIAAISQIHEENGNARLSYELLSEALTEFPDSDALRYQKALLADTLGYWSITENELQVLLQKDPENPQYLNALGYTLLVRTQRLDEAMGYIESAYEKADSDPAIIDSLGWGFFLKGEFEQSSYYLKKAWSILPDAEIAAHYGESLWKQRHYKEALEVWKSALETSPDTPLLLDTIKRLSPSLLEESK
ncbi:tetratricopeptide repeat protein [Marinomonas shanghaiensis]|uniref:tetratricopeptide repeat protein n=1 Tax=Marinomonas shanghaiensis TaxID=2202418 RepID=UPI003A95865A